MNLSCYLLFNGNCLEAMNYYQSVFGGELMYTKVGDSPMKGGFPPHMHGRVVNAKLDSTGISISASDWLHPTEQPQKGNTVCMYIYGATNNHTRNVFNQLAVGAEVTDELSVLPFGLYGALNDRFGIRWMFHSELEAV